MDKKLCFVKLIGSDINGQNVYEFLFTENIEGFWGENFEYKPCGLCNELIPNEDSYETVEKVKTEIKFDLIQDSTCFGFQDCIDVCVALAFENMDDYEEYPEPFRIVFKYGDSFEHVEEILAKRNILFC